MDSKPAQICKSHLILSLTPRVVSCSFPKLALSICILVLRLILLCHQSSGRKSVAILPKKAFFHEFSEMGLSSLWRVHCTIFPRFILEYASFLAEGMPAIMSGSYLTLKKNRTVHQCVFRRTDEGNSSGKIWSV